VLMTLRSCCPARPAAHASLISDYGFILV